MLRSCLICILISCQLLVLAQEKVFECDIDQRRAYQTHFVEDRSLSRNYLLLVSYEQLNVMILDSVMNLLQQKTYSIGLKQEKFYINEPLGFTADNGVIHGFYSNHDLTITGYLEFNLRSRRGLKRGQIPIDLNRKDEFLFHYIQDGTFFLASGIKKTSTLKLYEIRSPRNIKRDLFKVDIYRDLHAMFKDFSLPKSMDVGVLDKAHGVPLSITSKKIKVYPSAEEVLISFETSSGTEVIHLELDSQSYREDTYHYRRFKHSGKTNNSNSFLLDDYHFVARSSGEEIMVYVDSIGKKETLFIGRFRKEDKDIEFANEMEEGAKILTSSRFYRETPKDLIRDIDDGNIGISVKFNQDSSYVLTVGNFKESTNPLTNPYGSNLAGRTEGESSYFKVKLSKNFDRIEGSVVDTTHVNLNTFFESNDIKPKYVHSFTYEGSDFFSFYDKKERKYRVYKHTAYTPPGDLGLPASSSRATKGKD